MVVCVNKAQHTQLKHGEVRRIPTTAANTFSPNTRPLYWTDLNVLFSSHPTRPILHGQVISGEPNARSTVHFDLELPTIVQNTPALFDPPTCIAGSNGDSHLYAFFPPSQLNLEGGISCIWQRADELTSWNVLVTWPSERGNDAVASCWLDNERKVGGGAFICVRQY